MKQDYQEIRKELEEEKKKGSFIFLPSPILSLKDSFFMPLIDRVKLRDDEIYIAQKKARIHYVGLVRLAAKACVKWGVDNTRRTDDRSDKTYCSFMAVGGVMGADGLIQWQKAEKEMDLEVIEDELNEQYTTTWEKVKDLEGRDAWKKNGHKSAETFIPAMVRRDMIQHRKNKLTKTESGAKARVIRSVLGLQGTYSDVKKLKETTFVLVHYAPNPNHPEVKRHVLNSIGSVTGQIYGSNTVQNQIPYYDKDVQKSGDIIDAYYETEGDAEPEQTQDKKFEPAAKKEEEITLDIFQSSDKVSQVKILENLCKEVEGESVENYDKDDLASQTWRNGFFEHLIKEKGEKT